MFQFSASGVHQHQVKPILLCTGNGASQPIACTYYFSVQWSAFKFKIATLMHFVLHHRSPSYLSDLVQLPPTADPIRSRLRSSTARAATIIRTITKLGDRALFVAGPSTWNNLPPSLRLSDSHAHLRKQLKAQLFQLAFD